MLQQVGSTILEFVAYEPKVQEPHSEAISHIITVGYARRTVLLGHRRIADGKGKYNLRPDLACVERCVTASDFIMSVLKVAVQVECIMLFSA